MKFAKRAVPVRIGSLRILLRRPEVTLIVAAAGYGLNYWAWLLVGPLGPQLGNHYGLDWHNGRCWV